MNLERARQDYVFVKRVTPKYTGRLILPQSFTKPPNEGVVRAVGPGWVDNTGKLHPTTVKVGDRVIFTGDGIVLHDVEVNGEKVDVMREGLIMVALDPDA